MAGYIAGDIVEASLPLLVSRELCQSYQDSGSRGLFDKRFHGELNYLQTCENLVDDKKVHQLKITVLGVFARVCGCLCLHTCVHASVSACMSVMRAYQRA